MTRGKPAGGVAVICTAVGREYSAVCQHLEGPLQQVEERGTLYELGTFQGNHGLWTVALVQTGPGNTHAAVALERAISVFSPQVVLFVGIAGGRKEDVALGDVAAADYVYDYESGKEDADDYFPRIKTPASTHRMVQRAQSVARQSNWHQRIRTEIEHGTPNAVVKPLAAGGTLIADDRSYTAQLLARYCSDAVAVEMEGHGFLHAAHVNNGVDAIVIRGISDLLIGKNESADSYWQPIASRNAAAFTFELLSQVKMEPGPEKDSRTAGRETLGAGSFPFPSDCRKVADFTPFALGVHRAISTGGAPVPALPPYIERAHDKNLRKVISANSGGQLVVLSGGSSTGKTRTMWEAVQACLPQWSMLHPTTSIQLRQLLEQKIDDHTVLWLDNADLYLADQSNGPTIAERLIDVVHGSSSVLVLASMLPQKLDTLTSCDVAIDTQFSATRRLLLDNPAEIVVPESFINDPESQRALRRLAQTDPRLNTALETAGQNWSVTQVLSGGIHLVRRYNRGSNREGKAVIEAALDIRILGVRSPFPRDLLRETSVLYLASQPTEDDWFERALSYAAEEIMGIAMLAPTFTSSNNRRDDRFVLHPYLEQHGMQLRRGISVPPPIWDRLIDHLVDPGDLQQVGKLAKVRMLFEHAEAFFRKSIEAGHEWARIDLADLLEEQDNLDEASNELHLAAELHPFARVALARFNARRGMIDASMNEYVAATSSGFSIARLEMASMLTKNEYFDEAIEAWRDVKNNEQLLDRTEFAELLASCGMLVEAISQLRYSIDSGDTFARSHLVHLLAKYNHIDEAIDEIRDAGPNDHSCDAVHLAGLLRKQNKPDEAIAILKKSSEDGDVRAATSLGALYEELSEVDTALSMYRRAVALMPGPGVDAQESGAFASIIRLLRESHRDSEAHAELQFAVDELGDAADSGDAQARYQRSWLYSKMGRDEEALEETRKAADCGDPWYRWILALRLEKQGKTCEAIYEMRTAGQSGILNVRDQLARMLKRHGQDGRAQCLQRCGLRPDGSLASGYE